MSPRINQARACNVARTLRFSGVAWLVVLAVACGHKANCAPTETATQDDEDYPKLNPKSQQSFAFKGTADPSLRVVFDTVWGSTNRGCGVDYLEMDPFPGTHHRSNTVALPVKVLWDGNHFSGNVAWDGYLPGRCRWKFMGVIAVTQGETVNSKFGVAATNWLVVTNSPPLEAGQSPNENLTLQCNLYNKNISKSQEERGLVCGSTGPNPKTSVWWYTTTTQVEVNMQASSQ